MTTVPNSAALPVAIIGAGPVGLAAAAHLVSKCETPILFEAGATVGASLRTWGHVRLFSPWRYVVDQASVSLLEAHGWQQPPGNALPLGFELVRDYLEPLAALPAIKPHLHLDTRVLSVSRQGFDKLKTVGRETAPFVLHVQAADGREDQVLARAVIDASGTYTAPNPVGASGIPAVGERAVAVHIFYGIPDVLGLQRSRYAGKRVLVVGSGHSAFNALLDLGKLAEQAPGTTITWAIRRDETSQLYGGGAADALPARGALGVQLNTLAHTGVIHLLPRFRTAALHSQPDGIAVESEAGDVVLVDAVIATTGFRPDRSLLSELRLDLDPVVESPSALATLIDPNEHSCGTVPPHGAEQLRQPEPDLYIVGMKSYGRAPTFLLLTGYEQVRSVVCALTGDEQGAREVRLELPETGVCASDPTCCSTSADTLARIDVSGTPRCCSAAPVTVGGVVSVGARCCG